MLQYVDYHIHSSFSDGQPDCRRILDRAKELKLDAIAVTDHFDRFDENERTSSITDRELLEHFDSIRAYGERINQKVLCGIETCTDFKGNLRISDIVFQSCDLIITSPHYVEFDGSLAPGEYYNERYWDKYKTKVLNMAEGCGDILGHCEAYLPFGRLLIPGTTTYEQRLDLSARIAERFFDDDYISELAARLQKSGKAAELHCATSTPREKVIGTFANRGVIMSTGSDAHTLERVGLVSWGLDMLEKYRGKLLQIKNK